MNISRLMRMKIEYCGGSVLPHALFVLQVRSSKMIHRTEKIWFRRLHKAFTVTGRYHEAGVCVEKKRKGLKMMKRCSIVWVDGTTFWKQGRGRSGKAGCASNEGKKDSIGPKHPDTLTSMHNLDLPTGTGRWTEAEKLDVQVMGYPRQYSG